MNSTEDIVQETFMRRRFIHAIPNIVSDKLKGYRKNIKKVIKKVVSFITVSRLLFSPFFVST